MKKKYIQPRIKEVRIELQQMIALSIDVVDEELGGGKAQGKDDWDGFEEWEFDEF